MTVTLSSELMQPKPLSYFEETRRTQRKRNCQRKLRETSIAASKFGKMSNIYIQEPPTNGKV